MSLQFSHFKEKLFTFERAQEADSTQPDTDHMNMIKLIFTTLNSLISFTDALKKLKQKNSNSSFETLNLDLLNIGYKISSVFSKGLFEAQNHSKNFTGEIIDHFSFEEHINWKKLRSERLTKRAEQVFQFSTYPDQVSLEDIEELEKKVKRLLEEAQKNLKLEKNIEKVILKNLSNIGFEIDTQSNCSTSSQSGDDASPKISSQMGSDCDTMLSILAKTGNLNGSSLMQSEAGLGYDSENCEEEKMQSDSIVTFNHEGTFTEHNMSLEMTLSNLSKINGDDSIQYPGLNLPSVSVQWKLPPIDKTIRSFFTQHEVFSIEDLNIETDGSIINCIEMLDVNRVLVGTKNGGIHLFNLKEEDEFYDKFDLILREPSGLAIWDMRIDCLGTLWFTNSKNNLYRAVKINQGWEVRLIAEVSGYLKSRVQGKMLRVNQTREYMFWKASDKQLMRIEVKTGRKNLMDAILPRQFDFISDFKTNRKGNKLCILSRYGHLIIFIIDKNSNYKTIVKKCYDRNNPVFTSLAFSANGKRISTSSYNLVSSNNRQISLVVLRVDYGEMRTEVKYSHEYSVEMEPLQLAKHLDFIENDKRKMLMSIGLCGGELTLLHTKTMGFERYSENIKVSDENLVDFTVNGEEILMVFKKNRVVILRPKRI